MELIYALGFACWVVASWKWGDWNNLDRYLSSIYFFITGSLLYSYLTAHRLLWEFESPTFHLKHFVIDLAMVFIVFPCVTVIFLSHYPTGALKRIGYNLLWASVFVFHEWIAHMLGVLTYHRDWNLWWSFLVDALMFPLLKLNQTKPFFAYGALLAINALFFARFGNAVHLP